MTVMRAIAMSLLLTVTACASDPKPMRPVNAAADAAQAQMQTGMKALEHEDYPGAAGIFDRMLVQRPATEFDLIILYNDGVAHEGMGSASEPRSFFGRLRMVRARQNHRESRLNLSID